MLVMFQPLEATEQFQLIRISWYFFTEEDDQLTGPSLVPFPDFKISNRLLN